MTETPDSSLPSEVRRAPPIGIVVATAAAVLRGVWLLTLTSALAAVVLWGSLFAPFRFTHGWSTAFAAASLLVLLLPAGILFLTAITLTQIAHLPRTLVGQAREGRDRITAGAASVRGGTGVTRSRRVWNLGRVLLDLWTLVLDGKGVLLQYAGMVRLANPASLVVVAVAFGAAVLLIGIGAVALVLLVL